MYITPTVLAGGGLWPIQAIAHCAALASMHIGSWLGVAGLSGMHVQPFFPSRSVFIDPSALAITTVASPAIDLGAADMALWMGSPDFPASEVSATALSPVFT